MIQDLNFDDIADKFARNIYGTTKGKIRQAVLWQDLQALLAQMPQRPLCILDAGGGEGRIAAQLAALGHQVVLCDLSAQMIQRAQQQAKALGVEQRFRCVLRSECNTGYRYTFGKAGRSDIVSRGTGMGRAARGIIANTKSVPGRGWRVVINVLQ